MTIERTDDILRYLIQDPVVQEYLQLESFYDARRLDLETAVRQRMQMYSQGNDTINGIIVANAHDLYASNEIYRMSRTSLTRDAWYQQAAEAEGALQMISQPIGRNVTIGHGLSTNDIVMLARAVTDEAGEKILGVVAVDLKLSALETMFRPVKLGNAGFLYVVDETGSVVYAPANNTVYRLPHQYTPEVDGKLYRVGGTTYQLLGMPSEQTGWTVMAAFSYTELMEPTHQVRTITAMVLVVMLAVATLLVLQYSKLFTDPISQLRALMLEAENGNLDVAFTGEYVGEFAQLGRSFNRMIENMRHLLQMVYREQRSKGEAELKTLQAQIKPHFLYNTLDTIRWMAVEAEQEQIVQLVGALTKLFRISLSRGRDTIALKEELAHVESYLYIQKVRYEDKLTYEIQCQEALQGCCVKKLILQPLVENAIYHGIKQKRRPGRIIVRVQRCNTDLLLQVADNGIGMEAEQMQRLNDLLEAKTRPEEGGYGVFNVNDRIALSYGAGYGLRFAPNDPGGVLAEIRHPMLYDPTEKGGTYV